MPACRLAAIERLRHFKDPAAAEALKEAYYRAGAFPSADTSSILRRQALAALAETRQPAAVDLLVKVLREPPAEGADIDRQAKLDERLTAARALGNFQSVQATAALADVVAKEEDVGLQRCAQKSLVSITGQDLPDGKSWNEYLADPANREAIAARQPGGGIMEMVGFRR
ncbi:MAG: HEAT repeat domain-containing protein, partial [Gemmataceae bacterium]